MSSSSPRNSAVSEESPRQGASKRKFSEGSPLRIAIIGFGTFGQFIAKTFAKTHTVHVIDRSDQLATAETMGLKFTRLDLIDAGYTFFDVIVLAVSIISFEEVLSKLPKEMLRGKLIVDVLSVKVHARDTMKALLPMDCDILCTHPMFGPESGKSGWQGLPFLYDRVRIADEGRSERFLSIWEAERCKMIEMSCEQHDEYAANSQFVTHFVGRALGTMSLSPTPIDTKGFEALSGIVSTVNRNSLDLFHGLYAFNPYTESIIRQLKASIIDLELNLLKEKERILSEKILLN